MPAHPFRSLLPFAAALSLFASPGAPAFAFSKIGSEGGFKNQREGIVSTPLPPLPDVAAGSASPTAGTEPGSPPAGAEGKPPAAMPDARDPAASGASDAVPPTGTVEPGDNGEPRSQDANPSRTAPAQATDPNSTDEGELPEDGDDPAAPAAKAGAPSDAGAGPVTPDGKVTGDADGDADTEETAPADIKYGDADLPPAVRDLREKLIAIARTGNIEALRPYIEPGEDGTVLTFGGQDGDPIEYLKSASGDGEGVEILAILLELLEAGHVRSEPATDNETYVWPYFTGVAVDKLSKPQKVELFELVTAGDYQEMVNFGAYNFYRVGISPDGKLQFFVAGD